MKRSLYEILDISKDANQEEIKFAYRTKAKLHHEDKGGDHDAMAEINRAYDVLSDVAKRKRYDETGQENDVNFDKKFHAFIQDAFLRVVDSIPNVEQVDVIDKFDDFIIQLIAQNEASLIGINLRIEKFTKILDRLKTENENKIGFVLKLNIDELQKQKVIVEENIKFIKDCQEILADYEYDFEGSQEDRAMISGFTFAFHG